MSIKKRVIIGLIGTFMGLYFGNLQMVTRMGEVQGECTQVLKEEEKYKVYDISEGDIQISTSGQYYITCSTTSSPYRIIVDNAVKNVEIILEDVNIDVSKREKVGAIEINGEATLTVLGCNNIIGGSSQTGITITRYGALTISKASTGVLKVKGGITSPAIGGALGTMGGSLCINGGNIYAYGQGSSAAIGTSDYGRKSQKQWMKSIIINGGKIYCEAESGAAAIGGGKYAAVKSIKINGGYIVAKAGNGAKGIGSGYGYKEEEGEIEILGGTIVVYQGKQLREEPHAQAIQLSEKTIIGDEAIIIAIGHVGEVDGKNLFKQIDVNQLGKYLKLSIDEIGLQEQIDLEERQSFLNIHLPSGKYHIILQGENQAYLKKVSNNGELLDEQVEEEEESDSLDEQEEEKRSDSSDEQEEEEESDSSDEQEEEKRSDLLDEQEEEKRSDLSDEQEEEKRSDSSDEQEEEKRVDSLDEQEEEEKPDLSNEQGEDAERESSISNGQIEEVEKIEKTEESLEPSREDTTSHKESHTHKKNYRVRIYSTSVSTRPSWQNIKFLRTTSDYYISCGVKLK